MIQSQSGQHQKFELNQNQAAQNPMIHTQIVQNPTGKFILKFKWENKIPLIECLTIIDKNHE